MAIKKIATTIPKPWNFPYNQFRSYKSDKYLINSRLWNRPKIETINFET
jgi:hypothetical protein